jgi:hypothetical protein
MAKDRNGRQHQLREVTDPHVIERLKDQAGATLNDPIGGQDKDGRWYADTKLSPIRKPNG